MSIQSLLKKLQPIVGANEKNKLFKKSTGENFNIFSLMGFEKQEVEFHSTFLTELLNPRGTHGQGDDFLSVFLDLVEFKKFQTKNTYVNREEYIGKINEKCTEGGQIDILIKSADEKFAVVIENKIEAGDQVNQLIRYKNYLKKTLKLDSNHYRIFYLTLDGHPASEKSTGEENPKWVKNLSYEEHICKYLDKCIEVLGDEKTNLKNSIKQYKSVINQITGRGADMEKSKEVISELLEKDNLKTAELIYENYEAARDEILRNCLIPELQAIAKRNKIVFEYEEENKDVWISGLKKNYGTIQFYTKETRTYTYLRFEFLNSNFQNMVYGIWDDKGSNKKLRRAISKIQTLSKNPWWVIKKNMDTEFRNWTATEFIKLKNNPQEFLKPIEEKLKELLKYLDDNDLKQFL